MRVLKPSLPLLLLLALGSACGGEEQPAPEPPADATEAYATLASIRAASPLLTGSPIAAEVGVGALNRDRAELVLVRSGAELARLEPTSALRFVASEAFAQAAANADAVFLDDGERRTTEQPVAWTSASSLPVSLEPISANAGYYNQAFVLRGAGMIAPSEGELVTTISGTFTPFGATEAEPVEAAGPCVPAEEFSRDRCVVHLPPQLGGLREGTLDAELWLSSTLASGANSESERAPVVFDILPPDIFGLVYSNIALGQRLEFNGGGFVVGSGYSTVITLDGTLNGEPLSFELIAESASGDVAAITVRAVERDGVLVADEFEVARGVFDGTAQATVTDGTNTLEGAEASVQFALIGVRQVVWIRFLPGFYESLERFGLGAAAGAIEERVRVRIASIYDGFAVDVRTELPTDFDLNHVARIDIGGPDPNGIGLFGYDNTPGKDVGNLRLFDVIGGENFETQLDGYPGYGGVFIESMLWWGSDPPVDMERPSRAPAVDAGFDAVFTPVFEQPATPTEVLGVGDTARVREVDAAVSALANAIGETAAHELAHSLGLAQPDEPNAFHNNGDSPGCLMDHGEDRPFGERADLPGRPATRWCGDSEAYLAAILPL